jgi:O-antigen/teichoic acid export membrane protein
VQPDSTSPPVSDAKQSPSFETPFLSHLFRGVLRLGSGELFGRLCAIASIILLGHRYGASVVGVLTLGTTLSYYMQPVIDFGLRHVGARLMAQYPASAKSLMYLVQRRRLLMAVAVLPITLAYAAIARLPLDLKVWLFVFSGTGALYSLSLEWAAWGRESLQLVGLLRALVPLGILFGVAVGHSGPRVLWWVAIGNAVGFILQAAAFRIWWSLQDLSNASTPSELQTIRAALLLRRTSIMGLSMFCILAFNSIDMLMLGALYNSREVGLYSAAYRILNQVIVAYSVVTSVLYPKFARQTAEERSRALSLFTLLCILGAGTILALFVMELRRPILWILFGQEFISSAPLLGILACAIPLDFLTSYLNNAYISWGMETRVLRSIAIATAFNVTLNLLWLPMYGARAAAANTLASYIILLISLITIGRSQSRSLRYTETGQE